jgi:hypothetical protein
MVFMQDKVKLPDSLDGTHQISSVLSQDDGSVFQQFDKFIESLSNESFLTEQKSETSN